MANQIWAHGMTSRMKQLHEENTQLSNINEHMLSYIRELEEHLYNSEYQRQVSEKMAERALSVMNTRKVRPWQSMQQCQVCCPITQEPISPDDMVIDSKDGRCYSRNALHRWFDISGTNTSPVSRANIQLEQLQTLEEHLATLPGRFATQRRHTQQQT